MTFDLVTDWINWKQWSEVGGYNWHHLIFIFRTTFLCVVVVGTVTYMTEAFTIVVKLFRIHTLETSDDENPSDERRGCPHEIRAYSEQQETKVDETEKTVKKIREDQEDNLDEGEKSSPEKLGDENEKEEEKLNEGDKSSPEKLGDENKEQEEKLDEGEKSSPENVGDGSEKEEEKLDEGDKSSEGNVRDVSEKQYKVREGKWIYRLALILLILTGLFEDFPVVIITFHTAASPFCGLPARQEVGSVVTMVTIISSMINSLWTMIILFYELCGCQKKFNAVYYYKRYDIIFGKILLLGFIFLLFSGNFVIGMLTIAQITDSISLRVPNPLYLTNSVPASPLGPGLDGKRDEAMFIYIVMSLRYPHQVVLYDNEGNVKATSIWANQILNRLYIGQFEELSHLKDGTLTKAIPCNRVFPFVNNVEALQSLNINISDCKLIFKFSYYSANNDWNPFKELWQEFDVRIKIEFGFYLSNEKLCPWLVPALTVLEVNDTDILTSDIKDDLIKYTCSSACRDDANICDNAHHATVRSSQQRINAYVPPRLYLTINDLKVADSCIFNSVFEYSQEFCNESWSGVQTVDVPQEIQEAYPQFITIPELYRFDKKYPYRIPKYYCNEMWNSSMTCCCLKDFPVILSKTVKRLILNTCNKVKNKLKSTVFNN